MDDMFVEITLTDGRQIIDNPKDALINLESIIDKEGSITVESVSTYYV